MIGGGLGLDIFKKRYPPPATRRIARIPTTAHSPALDLCGGGEGATTGGRGGGTGRSWTGAGGEMGMSAGGISDSTGIGRRTKSEEEAGLRAGVLGGGGDCRDSRSLRAESCGE